MLTCAKLTPASACPQRSDAKQANWFQQGAIALAASAVILAAGSGAPFPPHADGPSSPPVTLLCA